jgi:transcriptional regulator with XRE-family HTH domain
LAAIRAARGLTQHQLGTAIDKSRQAIRQWESGRVTNIRVGDLRKVARAPVAVDAAQPGGVGREIEQRDIVDARDPRLADAVVAAEARRGRVSAPCVLSS